MNIVFRLFELYRDQGISVVSGLNPSHWRGLRSAPFTWFLRDGTSCTNGLGIALQELLFLECLFHHYKPERLFVIGNAFGWSAVAFALLNPRSQIVAMDAGFDRNSLDGLALTNNIAGKAGLNLEAVRGVSPQDVQRVLRGHFSASPDFVFIDGFHSNEQVVLDFRAVRPLVAPGAVFLFHDVHEFSLDHGLAQIALETGWTLRKLMSTPSGMALVYPPEAADVLSSTLEVFGPNDELLRIIQEEAWREAHPRTMRLRRGVVKIRNIFRSRLGKPALPPP
jgi:Methyltransferase domain